MNWKPGDLLTLETERFRLRSMLREDVTEDYLKWLADPEVMVGLNLPRRQLSRLQAVNYALSFDNQSRFKLIFEDRDGDRAFGFFTITSDPGHRSAETAVVLGDQSYWGKNAVIEGRTAIINFLFDTLKMHKVIGRPHGRNISSIFNYQALGFTCEAVLREQMRSVNEDERLDQLVFGLLRSEWEERKKNG
jgi:RimJ/RimL family protein N-acetyltransferase